MNKQVKHIAAAAAALSVVAGGVAGALAQTSDDPASVSHVSRVRSAPEQPVLAGLSGLSHGASASAADKAAVQHNLDNHPGARSPRGADLLPVVSEVAATPDRRIVLAAGEKYVCMDVHAEGALSSGCTTHQSATNPETPMVDVMVLGSGRYLVSALLPDGVSDAILKTANTRQTLTPSNNVASAIVSEPPTRLVLRSDAGLSTVALHEIDR